MASKKKFGNKLNLDSAPILSWEEGRIVEAEICDQVTLKTRFNPESPFLEVSLLNEQKGLDKEKKPVTYKPGDKVLLGVTGFLKRIGELPIGTAVQIHCTGKTPTDKGNDAWTFEVAYE